MRRGVPSSPRERRTMVVVRERDDVQCSGGQGLTGDRLPVRKKVSDLGNQTSVLMHFIF